MDKTVILIIEGTQVIKKEKLQVGEIKKKRKKETKDLKGQ